MKNPFLVHVLRRANPNSGSAVLFHEVSRVVVVDEGLNRDEAIAEARAVVGELATIPTNELRFEVIQ